MSSAIYPDPPPETRTAVCGHGEQQRLSNARLRLTFYNAPVAYCGPARPGSAFQQSAVSGLLPRARARRGRQCGDLVPPTDSPHWAKCTCNRPSPLVTGPEREGAGKEGERRWFGNPTGLTHG